MTRSAALPVLRDALLDALAVVLPVECAGCGAPDRGVCPACRAALAPRPRERVLDSGLRVHAGLAYEGAARSTLLALKQHDRSDAAGALAPALAAAVRAAAESAAAAPGAADGGLLLLAIPSTRAARRRRGLDPVRLLLSRCGLRPRRLLGLRPGRAGAAQKSLGAAARAENSAARFRASADLAGRRILLVDDVVTTGATLLSAERELLAAGAAQVVAAVLADTPRRVAARRADASEAPTASPADSS